MRGLLVRMYGCILALPLVAGAEAATIDFQTALLDIDAAGMIFNIGGVRGHVAGYHVEFDRATGTGTVYGPVSTAEVPVTSASFDFFGFGRQVLAGSGQPVSGLGLLSWHPMGHTDPDLCCATFTPGFDNSTLGTVDLPTLQFALFTFDTPVDAEAAVLANSGNSGRSIWAAAGNAAPDFSAGFGAALQGYSIQNLHHVLGGPRSLRCWAMRTSST